MERVQRENRGYEFQLCPLYALINIHTIGRNLKPTKEFPDAIFLAKTDLRGAKRFGYLQTLPLVTDYQSLDIYQAHLDCETHQSGDIVNFEAFHQLGAVRFYCLGADT